MLSEEIRTILEASRDAGWVLEPDAKRIFKSSGFDVPDGVYTSDPAEAASFAEANGYPVVAKVVSADILHKSDAGGVAVGIRSREEIEELFDRFSKMEGYAGVVVEDMVSGIELIVGAKKDAQFGPVVLLGIGGIGVEIYKDTSIRMAPIGKEDVLSMIRGLQARKIIEGFRGAEAVNVERLSGMLVAFSELVMEMEDQIESIDLNPVMCSSDRCIIADARIILG